jgi:hypothetical protein
MNKTAKALALRELSSEDLDAVSGGWFCCFAGFKAETGGTGGQNDPTQMFQQILQQLIQG